MTDLEDIAAFSIVSSLLPATAALILLIINILLGRGIGKIILLLLAFSIVLITGGTLFLLFVNPILEYKYKKSGDAE